MSGEAEACSTNAVGMPRHKVSRLGIEGVQDVPRAAVVFRGVGADPVAVELGEGSLGEEAEAGRERFDFAELAAVIGLPGPEGQSTPQHWR